MTGRDSEEVGRIMDVYRTPQTNLVAPKKAFNWYSVVTGVVLAGMMITHGCNTILLESNEAAARDGGDRQDVTQPEALQSSPEAVENHFDLKAG